MTQKELSYFEDAIGHEQNIIKILEESIKKIENEELINFMTNEYNKHNDILERLMNKLEGEANAWSTYNG